MKIKQQPEDFQVEELTDVTPGSQGDFAFYRLEKRGWSTPDALQAIRRRWQLDLRRLSYGGLKDRHAHTVQYLTVFHGPKRKLTHHDIHVEYLGQVPEPFTSREIRANRFRLILRALRPDDAAFAENALAELRQDGLPNYFDDQRFGSSSSGTPGESEFIARYFVEGKFEQGLRQALAGPYEFDRAPQKREKAILREHWGDWATCKQRLPRGHARSLVDYLAHHPQDFRGAVARLRPDLRGLYLSAFQSYLWNKMLARWLNEHCRADQLLPLHLRLGDVPAPRQLDETQRAELANLHLPLPTARLHQDAADPRLTLIEAVLREEGLTLSQLKIKGIREMFFSKGERAAWFIPAGLNHEAANDEVNRGKRKLTLEFDLPRGSYATLIVKRVTMQKGDRM